MSTRRAHNSHAHAYISTVRYGNGRPILHAIRSSDQWMSHLDYGFHFDLEAVSETTRSSLRGCKFQNFPGGACPQTPLARACLRTP